MDHTWKETIAAKVNDARVAVAGLEPRAKALAMKANDNLRSNPAKWTGIAAGAGLGVGLLGRFLQHRAQNRRVPAVVIIEAAC